MINGVWWDPFLGISSIFGRRGEVHRCFCPIKVDHNSKYLEGSSSSKQLLQRRQIPSRNARRECSSGMFEDEEEGRFEFRIFARSTSLEIRRLRHKVMVSLSLNHYTHCLLFETSTQLSWYVHVLMRYIPTSPIATQLLFPPRLNLCVRRPLVRTKEQRRKRKALSKIITGKVIRVPAHPSGDFPCCFIPAAPPAQASPPVY